jgi:hypothetical protein
LLTDLDRLTPRSAGNSGELSRKPPAALLGWRPDCLAEVLGDHPQLRACGHLGLRDGVRSVRLAFWDDASGRLVDFREIRGAAPERYRPEL